MKFRSTVPTSPAARTHGNFIVQNRTSGKVMLSSTPTIPLATGVTGDFRTGERQVYALETARLSFMAHGVAAGDMEHDKFNAVNQRIREAAQDAGAPDRLSVSIIEHFLRTADDTWDGAGSGQFTTAQVQNNEAYRRAVKNALKTLFHTLADLLPAEAQLAPHRSGSDPTTR
jgi:hypothetical protein